MNYILTEEQQKIICRYFNVDYNNVEFWQICELLDKIIRNLEVEK